MSLNYTVEELKQRHHKAKERFTNYLKTNKNRRTPERFAILEEIYIHQKHFDAEALYIKMKQNAYRVSRATIYNTLDILVECALIKRHQFGHNKTLYEKSFGFVDHDHLICTNCGSITEFKDERVDQSVLDKSQEISFTLVSHSLNIYGICNKCK